jgi:integrase
MATIIRRPGKNGQPSYRAQVRLKGAPPLSATFSKRSEAQRWVQQTETAIREGRYVKPAPRHTLAALIDRYHTDVLPHKRDSTIPDQRRQLRWWKTQLGHRFLVDITPALIAEHRDALKRGTTSRGTPRSNATVKRYLAALSHAFTMAVREWQWCDDNPVCKITKPREPRGRVRYLGDAERPRLLQACQESRNPYLHTIVILALATGGRRGELLGLRWSDVDLKRAVLVFRDTKNGDTRSAPVTCYALAVLTQHAKVRRLDTALVFPDATGEKPLGIGYAFEKAVARAGLQDFRFHDLRHTFASYLAMHGATLAEIAEALGHKTLAMVKRYAHLSDQHTRQVVERMNRAVFGK